MFSKKYINNSKQYSFHPFILASSKCWLSWMLITRKAAHPKFIWGFHDSMNWRSCRSFKNLQIWYKNSDFERENSKLQYCSQFNFAPHWHPHVSGLSSLGRFLSILLSTSTPVERGIKEILKWNSDGMWNYYLIPDAIKMHRKMK